MTDRMEKPLIVCLGGTFDPVHRAHLAVAQDVAQALQPERFLFIPAAQNPLKAKAPWASAVDRLRMLEMAVANLPGVEIWPGELTRGGPSYTLDTVRALQEAFPGREIGWLIGADGVADLPRWHRIDELAQACTFVVVERPGFATDPPAIEGLRLLPVQARRWEISASAIREKLLQREPVDTEVPETVGDYIRQRRLYTQRPTMEDDSTQPKN